MTEKEPKEIWNVEQQVRDMRNFCIHIRHQTEKMERQLKQIILELEGKDE